MGGGQSSSEEGGFRVFKVNPGSPAHEAGLEVFFDFIMEIAGVKLDSDQGVFFQLIQEAADRRTPFVVYNIRTHKTREVYVTPRRWGGAGLLGAVVRYDGLDNAGNQGIRVLDVFANSPAQQAGLVPFKDFLLGTTEVMFRDMDELIEVVQLGLGKHMQIYVFNSDTEVIREVTLIPDNTWGGDGLIGADIRTGLLHRIPPPRKPLAPMPLQAVAPPLGVAPPAVPLAAVPPPAAVPPTVVPGVVVPGAVAPTQAAFAPPVAAVPPVAAMPPMAAMPPAAAVPLAAAMPPVAAAPPVAPFAAAVPTGPVAPPAPVPVPSVVVTPPAMMAPPSAVAPPTVAVAPPMVSASATLAPPLSAPPTAAPPVVVPMV